MQEKENCHIFMRSSKRASRCFKSAEPIYFLAMRRADQAQKARLFVNSIASQHMTEENAGIYPCVSSSMSGPESWWRITEEERTGITVSLGSEAETCRAFPEYLALAIIVKRLQH